MKIRNIEERDIQKLIEFNIKTYQERDKVEESIKYRFFYNPLIENSSREILIAEDLNQDIIGQILLMPSEFYYDENKYPAFWGMDYIVDESKRGSPAGTILAKKATNIQYHFGAGLSDISLSIHLVFKELVVGYMSKYLKLNSFFSLLKFLHHKKKDIDTYTFPEFIITNGYKFKRVHDYSEILSKENCWNKNLIEFTRKEIFLKWRFFHYLEKYFIYKLDSTRVVNNEKPIYFVVRPIIWKKANCLLLVDYRFEVDKNEFFNLILKATTKLSKKLNMAATITACSLRSCDETFRNNYFFRFGKKMDVVSNFKDFKESSIPVNDKIFMTFADSDGDFYYGNNKW